MKSKEQIDREAKIDELERAVKRAEGRGQKDTSYHVLLDRIKNPPAPAKEKKDKEQ